VRGKPECIGTLATGLRCCGVERAGAAFWCGLRWGACAGTASGAGLVPQEPPGTWGKVLRRRRQDGGRQLGSDKVWRVPLGRKLSAV
jgi:hypothetical protein